MGKWTECICEASKPFHALEHLFYFAVAFLHSGQPGFQLLLVRSSFFVWIIFRLVRHDHFIFFSSLSSLFVCSVFQGNHCDESSALATQCETPCATRLSYHGICTIFKSNWYDLRNSQMPHCSGVSSTLFRLHLHL